MNKCVGRDLHFSYDLRGNLIQKSAKIGPETTTLSWDYFDCLVQVETSQKRVSYKYDATGRRTERLMEDLVNSTSKVNKWTYLGDEQWSELNDLNQVLAVTLNGESIDDIVSLSITPGIALDPVKNHLGSIHAWVNADTGAVVQKQKYSAYGETTVTQSSPVLASLGMLRGFTGRELDVDTKFQHNRARWYDSETGRWLSPDPSGFAGRISNFYGYTGNRPINSLDSNGKQARAICYGVDLTLTLILTTPGLYGLSLQLDAYQQSINDIDLQIGGWKAQLDSPVCNDKAYIRTRLADLNLSRDTAVTQMNLINTKFGAAFAEAMAGGAFAALCKALPI